MPRDHSWTMLFNLERHDSSQCRKTDSDCIHCSIPHGMGLCLKHTGSRVNQARSPEQKLDIYKRDLNCAIASPTIRSCNLTGDLVRCAFKRVEGPNDNSTIK